MDIETEDEQPFDPFNKYDWANSELYKFLKENTKNDGDG